MDIAAWLRSLGLEQYEPAFRENNVDAGVLPRLTSEDLKDIGVTSVGHRRRMLDAIAVLQEEPGDRAQQVPEEVPSPGNGRDVQGDGRQLDDQAEQVDRGYGTGSPLARGVLGGPQPSSA